MADLAHEPWAEDAAEHVAYRPASTEKAERCGAETFGGAPDRQDQGVDSARKDQEGGTEKKGADGKKLSHVPPL